jgi:GxxExxY protein
MNSYLSTSDKKAAGLVLSHEVIGAAIEVHRFLGPGLLESVYESALCEELSLRSVGYQRQLGIPLRYKGRRLDCDLKLDLLVEGSLIVEVKALEKVLPIHKAQLLTYLRLQGIAVGLLLNFNVEVLRDGIRRILNG